MACISLLAMVFSNCSTDSEYSGSTPLAYSVSTRITDIPLGLDKEIRIFFNEIELPYGTNYPFTEKDKKTGVLKVYVDSSLKDPNKDVSLLTPQLKEVYTIDGNNIIELIWYKNRIMINDPDSFINAGIDLILSEEKKPEQYEVYFNEEYIELKKMYNLTHEDSVGMLKIIDKNSNKVIYNEEVTLNKNSMYVLLQVNDNFTPLHVDENEFPVSNQFLKLRMVYFGKSGDKLIDDTYKIQIGIFGEDLDSNNMKWLSEEIVIHKGEFTPYIEISFEDYITSSAVVLRVISMEDESEIITFDDFVMFFVEPNEVNDAFNNKIESYNNYGDDGMPNLVHKISW